MIENDTVLFSKYRIERVIDEGGAPYTVIEYLDSVALAPLLRDHGRFAPGLAADLMLQACESLAEAHALGIVHRDIEPSNLFITHRAGGARRLEVLDFTGDTLSALCLQVTIDPMQPIDVPLPPGLADSVLRLAQAPHAATNSAGTLRVVQGRPATLVAVLARERSANDNVTPGHAPIHASVTAAGSHSQEAAAPGAHVPAPSTAEDTAEPARARTKPARAGADDEDFGARQ